MRAMMFRCLAAAMSLPLAPHAAEALDFELSDGRRFVRLSDLPPRPTVVNFWRTDCPACIREMPALADFGRRTGTRVVAVALQSAGDTLAAPGIVLDALRPPVLALSGPREPRGLLARFGNPAGVLPFTAVVGGDRRPCARRAGEIDNAWLAATLARCSDEAAPPVR